ncbi:hypothetical protein ABMA58_19170, partial [Oceanospirillum sp. HFRX-1_2]
MGKLKAVCVCLVLATLNACGQIYPVSEVDAETNHSNQQIYPCLYKGEYTEDNIDSLYLLNKTPLVVSGGSVYSCDCFPKSHVLGASEARSVSGRAEIRHTSGSIERRSLKGAIEERSLS